MSAMGIASGAFGGLADIGNFSNQGGDYVNRLPTVTEEI